MPARTWKNQSIINTTVAGDQLNSAAAALADGGYIITWQSGGYSGDTSIMAQRFDAFGAKVGTEFLVEEGDTGFERDPSVDQLSNGSILITWADQYQQSTTDVDIQGMIIAPNGTRTSLNLVGSGGDEREAKVVANGDQFAVVYTNYSYSSGDVLLNRYDLSGANLGSAAVNTTLTAGLQGYSDVALLLTGNLAVSWYNGGTEIRIRVFNGSAQSLGPETVINTSSNNVTNPSVTALADGGFIATWEAFTSGTGWDVRGRIFDSAGNAATGDFSLSQIRSSTEISSVVAALPTGGFLAVWDGGNGIHSQLFDAFGGRLGQEQTLWTGSFGFVQENGSRVTADTLADGRVLLTWTAYGDSGADIRSMIVDPRDGIVTGTGSDDLLLGSDQLSDDISGSWGSDDLRGLKGDDNLSGDDGNDYLDGGLGADIMAGGAGGDTFIVDNLADEVLEFNEAGADLVKSSISYTLGANVENLTLIGTSKINGVGNELANALTGNDAVNRLDGLGGSDTLDGGLGADAMYGGLGDDTFIVDNVGDRTIDVASGGTDTVLSSVSFTLIGQVDNLTLTGTDAINATGSSLANVITGNGANNILAGGGGADTFVFASNLGPNNIDTITDFSVVQDTIHLDQSVFTAFTVLGPVTATQFQDLSKGAADGFDRIIYDRPNGDLYYDADGSGAAFTAIKFADIQNSAALTYADFLIIA